MEFFDKAGKMAIGSRLRLLAAQVTDEAAGIYELYNTNFAPKWFPVLFILAELGEQSVTGIAEQIGHSQPSVTKLVKEMTTAGLAEANLAAADKRRNVVKLTAMGTALAQQMRVQCADVEAAVNDILQQATHNLWEALAEWEFLLNQKPLLRRVQEQKKRRESQEVQLVAYKPRYQAAFRALNEEWISTCFTMEAADYKALDNPEEYILNRGGKIFVALYHGEPLGVCALLKMDDPDYDFELAKMAVSPQAQGKNMGWLLGQAVITAAREMGATRLFLESNTLLKPAISLYHKLGFQKVTGRPSPYERSNIQMELHLTN